MGSGPRNAAALDDGASARAELACACCWASSSALRFFAILGWFCFRSKFCLTRGKFFSYTSSRKLATSLSFARLQVVDVVAFREQVLAEHVSPNLREISAEFMGKTGKPSGPRMAKVHKLVQEVLMFG